MISTPFKTSTDFDDGEVRPLPQVVVHRPSASSPSQPIVSASEAAAASRPQATPLADLEGLLTFARVTMGLAHLYPRFVMREMADMRVALGVDVPSGQAERGWEAIPSHVRNDMNIWQETPGPKVWLVSISRGHIAPYATLLTLSVPRRIIARSLYSILDACIQHGLFTWEAAEREFKIPFRGIPLKRHYINVSVSDWGKRREIADVTPSAPLVTLTGAV